MSGFDNQVISELARMERLSSREPSEKYQKVTFDHAKELGEKLGKILNGGSQNPAVMGVLYALRREHRYLQNVVVIVLLQAIGLLHKVEGTDARNEFAIGLSRKVFEALNDELFFAYSRNET